MERLLPWLRRTSLGYAALAVVLVVAALVAARRDERRPTPAAPVAVRAVEPERYLVHVAGAVRAPGVYRIGGDGRVIQAIRLAGGPTRLADLGAINLAAPVADGQQIVVPTRGVAGSSAGDVTSGPVSLSSATVEQLDTLDGIGPTLAQRIVRWRDQHGGFSSVDQLADVPGIGAARLEALRARVVP